MLAIRSRQLEFHFADHFRAPLIGELGILLDVAETIGARAKFS